MEVRGIAGAAEGECAARAGGVAGCVGTARGVAKEPPHNDRTDHHDDGDQRRDHAEADAAPAGRHRTVAARPLAAFPFTAVLLSRRPRWRSGPTTEPRFRLRIVPFGPGVVGSGGVRLVVV